MSSPRRTEAGLNSSYGSYYGDNDQDSGGCCGFGDTFLTSPTGFTKLAEIAIAVVSQFLILYYGVEYSERLGIGYQILLTCNSASLMASFVFLLCYTVSKESFVTVRPSLFEMLLNLLYSALYITASTLLLASVFSELYYLYHTVTGFSAYPALTAVYILGFAAGMVHIVDAILATIFWRKLPRTRTF